MSLDRKKLNRNDEVIRLSAKDAFIISGILVGGFYLLAFAIGLLISIIGVRNFGYDDGWFVDSSYTNVFFFFLLASLLLSIPIAFFRLKGHRVDLKTFGFVKPVSVNRWLLTYAVTFILVIAGFIISEHIPGFLKFNQDNDLKEIIFSQSVSAFILGN